MKRRTLRMPFDPIDNLVRIGVPYKITGNEVDQRVADATGYSTRAVSRWRKSGIMPETADIVAIRLGSHPMALWPDEWMETVA